MTGRHMVAALLALPLGLTGCSETASAPPVHSGNTESAGAQQASGDIYVAAMETFGGRSPIAMGGGTLMAEQGCLVVRNSASTHVAVFAADLAPGIRDGALVLGTQTFPLGSVVQTVGGQLPHGSASQLLEPLPESCRKWRLWQVSSMARTP